MFPYLLSVAICLLRVAVCWLLFVVCCLSLLLVVVVVLLLLLLLLCVAAVVAAAAVVCGYALLLDVGCFLVTNSSCVASLVDLLMLGIAVFGHCWTITTMTDDNNDKQHDNDKQE